MKRLVSRWKAVVFGAAFVGSLGFGAVQAFASPPPPAEGESACTNTYCRKICGDLGGNWVPQYGRCVCCG